MGGKVELASTTEENGGQEASHLVEVTKLPEEEISSIDTQEAKATLTKDKEELCSAHLMKKISYLLVVVAMLSIASCGVAYKMFKDEVRTYLPSIRSS